MIAILIRTVTIDVDLRGVHEMRKRVRVGAGEGALFLNKRRTMVRIVDAAQAIHQYYAPNGHVFDVKMLNEMCGAMRLRVLVTPYQTRAIEEGGRRKKISRQLRLRRA